MENKFLKGIVSAVAYYAAGALLAFIVYLVLGRSYQHAPALHHIILFALWLGGCAWALFSIINRFLGKNVAYNRGAALAHIVVCSAAFVVVYQDIRLEEREEAGGINQSSITTEFSGDTTIVRHHGNIVYIKIGDSVYIDELSKIFPPDSLQKNN